MKVEKTLWSRIEDNYNANTVTAKVANVAAIFGLAAAVGIIVADVNAYTTTARALTWAACAAVVVGIVGLTLRPAINHFDGDPNT